MLTRAPGFRPMTDMSWALCRERGPGQSPVIRHIRRQETGMSALANHSFSKMNGIGNAIVVVDLRDRPAAVTAEEARAVASPAVRAHRPDPGHLRDQGRPPELLAGPLRRSLHRRHGPAEIRLAGYSAGGGVSRHPLDRTADRPA